MRQAGTLVGRPRDLSWDESRKVPGSENDRSLEFKPAIASVDRGQSSRMGHLSGYRMGRDWESQV